MLWFFFAVPVCAVAADQCFIEWKASDCPDQGLVYDDCNPYNDPYGYGYNHMQFYWLLGSSPQNRIVWVTIYSYEDAAEAQEAWDKLVSDSADWSYSEVYEGPSSLSGATYMVVGDKLNGADPQDKDDWTKLGIRALYRGNRINIATQTTEGPFCNDLTTSCQETSYASILSDYKNALSDILSYIDGKCGGGGGKTKPEITLEPSEFPLFQASILTGQGFTIKIHDADGVRDANGASKLNLSKLRIYLNNADISMHFVNTALNKKIVTWSESANDLKLIIKPDPGEFMTDHDVFGIPWNGDHKISFAICDTDGLCDQSDYTIYFGPIAMLGSPSLSFDSSGNNKYVKFSNCVIANTGIEIPDARYYFVLALKSGNSVAYTSQVEKFSGGYEYRTGIYSYTSFDLPTGGYYMPTKLFDVSSLMNVTPTFYLGIFDPVRDVYYVDSEKFYIGYIK